MPRTDPQETFLTEGVTAAGIAATENPVLCSGVDAGGFKRAVKVNARGERISTLVDSSGNPYAFAGSPSSVMLPVAIVGNDGKYQAFVDATGRLSTNSNVTFPESLYVRKSFLNGTSKAMNVNGATTPVSFRFTPATGEVYNLERFSYALASTADMTATGLFGQAALTNGLQINVKSKGVLYTMATLKDSYDFFGSLGESTFTTRVTGVPPTNYWRGHWNMLNRTTLDNSFGDYVEALVQDNLTAFTVLNMFLSLWKLNG